MVFVMTLDFSRIVCNIPSDRCFEVEYVQIFFSSFEHLRMKNDCHVSDGHEFMLSVCV